MALFRFTAPDQAEWLLEGAAPEHGSLSELAARVAGHRLLLIAPGEMVTLTRTKVASRHRATMLRAIPYALEDNLAEDVEDLHFAVGTALRDGEIAVAVVRHEALRAWLDTCAEAGITPSAVVPAQLLLPYEDGIWSVLVENDKALVRSGPWLGFATDLENLEPLLNLALAEAGEQRPQGLRVWGSPSLALAYPDIEIHYQDTAAEPLQIFAANYQDDTVINLLQGPYSRKAHLSKWLKPWRAAAILAAVWLGLQWVLQVVEYRQLSREQVALRAEMERVYREAVPGARRIVNPRVQLEQQLQELRQAAGGTDTGFLDLLYQGGQTLATFDNVTLRALRYRDNQLDIDLEGDSLETLDSLKQQLTEQSGLNIQMRTTRREDKVESQLVLRKDAL